MSFNYGNPGGSMPPMMPNVNMGPSGPMMPPGGPQNFMNPMLPSPRPPPPNMVLPAIPGMNDTPLEFNRNKSNSAESSTRWRPEEEFANKEKNRQRSSTRKTDRRERARTPEERTEITDEPDTLWNSGMLGMGYPPLMGMIMDPTNMMGMNNYGSMMQPIIQPDGTMMPPDTPAIEPMMPPVGPIVKEVIHFKSCVLYPPSPAAPIPTTRERPPGCRTVFVGGLPENITEEILTEVFERCGEITTLRLSKKNFCHIRFMYETSVDAALYLSGYRIRIADNSDVSNTGRLHVDYAQARDDQYEWECKQRKLIREQRHRERMEEERLRPPSPPPVQHYTDHEASTVAEKIKADESFPKAVQIIITWLERGDCNKRNSNSFYSMIQSTNSHVRRLLAERTQYEDELQKAKEIMKGRMQGILIQFGQIERVFAAASHKKAWDHFTKAQRKNIDMWKKQTQEIRAIQLENIFNERTDEEMDVSETDEMEPSSSPRKRQRLADTTSESEKTNQLREENDSLKCQLEAYKNEVDVVKSELQTNLEPKDKQIEVLHNTLKGMQKQMLELAKKHTEDEAKVKDLQLQLSLRARTKIPKECPIIDLEAQDSPPSVSQSSKFDEVTQSSTTPPIINDRDAKLIGLISIFLHVHPFGAGVDYIWSYLQKSEPSLKPSDVENVMSKFPTLFKQELSGIGANMERRWQFNGFQMNQIINISS